MPRGPEPSATMLGRCGPEAGVTHAERVEDPFRELNPLAPTDLGHHSGTDSEMSVEGHGWPRLGDISEFVGGAPGAEPVLELDGRDRPAHVVALSLVTTQARELGVG